MPKPSDWIADALADEIERADRHRGLIHDQASFVGAASGVGRPTNPTDAKGGALGGVTVLKNPYAGEIVGVSSTAVSIAGTGAGLFDTSETVDVNAGFLDYTAGDVPTAPRDAIYAVDVTVRWTDGHTGGGTVTVDTGGSPYPSQWDDTGPWNRFYAVQHFHALTDETIDVTVTPSDASAHTADVTVRLSVLEPLRLTAPDLTGVYLVANDFATGTDQKLWFLPSSSTVPETVPLPTAMTSTSNAITVGCVAGAYLLIGDTIGRIWRATGKPADAADWTLETTHTGGDDIEALVSDGTKVRALAVGASTDMLESDDNGATWSETALAGGQNRMTYNGGTWLRYSEGGGSGPYTAVETSSDGDSWSSATAPTSESAAGTIAVASDGSTFVAGWRVGSGASGTADGYTSTNTGTSWTSIDLSIGDASGDGTINAAVTAADTLILCDPGNNDIYRNAGGGWAAATWTPLGAGTDYIGWGFADFGVDASSDRIVLCNDTDYVVISDDDGATWSNVVLASGEDLVLNGAFG